jgi:hypothetical protein
MTALVALALALALGPSSEAQQAQRRPPQKAKKVWTNDDIDALRARVPLSVTGQELPAAAAEPAAGEKAAGEATAKGPLEPYVRERDPKYYQQRYAALRAEVDRIDAEIRRLREFRANPNTGQQGLALGAENLSLTPENQIQLLEERRRKVQQDISDLEDQARRAGIPLGLLR